MIDLRKQSADNVLKLRKKDTLVLVKFGGSKSAIKKGEKIPFFQNPLKF